MHSQTTIQPETVRRLVPQKARIDKFRNRFPPVVVTFLATHPGGETHPLLLPQPKVAFVHKGATSDACSFMDEGE